MLLIEVTHIFQFCRMLCHSYRFSFEVLKSFFSKVLLHNLIPHFRRSWRMTTRLSKQSADPSSNTWKPHLARTSSLTLSKFCKNQKFVIIISEVTRMPEDEYDNSKKAHVKRKAGKKAEKKKSKDGHEQVRRCILLMKDHQS